MDRIPDSESDDTGSNPVATTNSYFSLARCLLPQFGQKYSPRLIQKRSSVVVKVQ